MEKGTIDGCSIKNCVAMAVYEAIFVAIILAGMNSNYAFYPVNYPLVGNPYLLQIPLFYFIGFIVCHKVSGGHLNPAITVAVFFAEWRIKECLKPCIFILVG